MHKPLVFSLLLWGVIPIVAAVEPAAPARVDEVAERGSQVMPFDLDKTLHVFNKTETGGVQQVVAKRGEDAEQVRLIREHLAHIAVQFTRGDFSGPARIHGEEMPGLAELRAAAHELRVVYRDLPTGGQIDYWSVQPTLAAAIHRYFDAQLSDHARHAITGHPHERHAGSKMHSTSPEE